MTEFYLAFSKHGTYTFITANKIFDDKAKPENLDGLKFTVAYSRTSSLRGATKLMYWGINNNTPPAEVYAFFNKLRELGWKIDDKAYIAKNNLPAYVKPAETISLPAVDSIPTSAESEAKTSTEVVNDPQAVPDAPTNENTIINADGDTPHFGTEKLTGVFLTGDNEPTKPELGVMQQAVISLINGAISFAELAKKTGEALNKKFGPSDVKRVAVALEKKNLVKIEGDSVSKV